MVMLLEPDEKVVIDLLNRQVLLFKQHLQLRQKAAPDRLEKSLAFSSSLRFVRARMGEMDPQASADTLQVVGRIDASIISVQVFRHSEFQNGFFQRIFQGIGFLFQVELGVGDDPGFLVQPGDEIELFFALRVVGVLDM